MACRTWLNFACNFYLTWFGFFLLFFNWKQKWKSSTNAYLNIWISSQHESHFHCPCKELFFFRTAALSLSSREVEPQFPSAWITLRPAYLKARFSFESHHSPPKYLTSTGQAIMTVHSLLRQLCLCSRCLQLYLSHSLLKTGHRII